MKNVVVIGGGTGSFTVLKGLKNYPVKLSAVVSMADSGGSTGILRDELGVLPTGDIRQCLVALSDSSEKMRELMSYRFEEGSLKGHSFGNLFLCALEKTSGSFSEGVKEAMKILNVRGDVIPVTTENVNLLVELNNGEIIFGEDQIEQMPLQGKGVKRVFYGKNVSLNPEVAKRIAEADTIVIGPGSYYSSIIPHLIIPELASSVNKSRAKVVYVANLTNKKDHTDGFDVDKYVSDIETYIGKDRINYVVYNIGKPPEYLLNKYIEKEGEKALVEFKQDSNLSRKYYLFRGDFIGSGESKVGRADKLAEHRSLIRHDSDKLAKAIVDIVDMKLWIFDLDDVLYSKTQLLGDSYEKLLNITPFPETHAVLSNLKGIKTLVTMAKNGKDIQNKKIDLLKVRPYFDKIIITESSDGKKSAFEELLLSYKISSRKEVIVVGDRRDNELRYGNLLGCTSILFNLEGSKYSNLLPKDDFEVSDFTINSLGELLNLDLDV